MNKDKRMMPTPPLMDRNAILITAGVSAIVGIVATPFAGACVAAALTGGLIESGRGLRRTVEECNHEMNISAAIDSHVISEK